MNIALILYQRFLQKSLNGVTPALNFSVPPLICLDRQGDLVYNK